MQPLPDRNFIDRRRSAGAHVSDRDVWMVLTVVQELTRDPRTRREPVRVSAQNDVVILTGTVGSWATRAAAASVARRAVEAGDFCDAMGVACGAPDVGTPDPFDRLVGGLRARGPARLVRTSSVEFVLIAAPWLVLPWLVVAGVVPVVPAVVAGLTVAVTAATAHFLRLRAAPPVRRDSGTTS